MIEYFAFLRGINVGGKNSIKMEELRKIFEDCGFSKVRSYIQSGNIIFSYKKAGIHSLSEKIEAQIKKATGLEVAVMVRTREQLDAIVKLDPFKGKPLTEQCKHYIVFMSAAPTITHPLPFHSEKDGVELVTIIGEDAFLLSFPLGDHFGFPNGFIEKKYKIPSSSRYSHVVTKMLELSD
jgi:uncharacterized protein (DUF1697 family)